MAARDELVAAIAGRYAQGDRAERGRILDEFQTMIFRSCEHALRPPRTCRALSNWKPSSRLPNVRVGACVTNAPSACNDAELYER
jgi:hypothetical protein